MPITALDSNQHNNFISSRLLILATFLCLLTSGCAASINSGTLNERLSISSAPLVLLDVRNRSEYRKGHLPGAVNIPVYVLPFRLVDIPTKGKDRPVVVYCAHGPRAGLAGFILRIAGYSNVLHLQGDMAGWNSAGLPVEKP